MKKLLSLKDFFLKEISTFTAIIVMFTYTILLDRDLQCTCRPNHSNCGVYMALPIFIILLLILYTDRSFQRMCRYTFNSSRGQRRCKSHCCSFCDSLTRHILKAGLVGGLWAAFVLIDGDWFVCCANKKFDPQLPCKDKNITAEERLNTAELKNDSRIIGFFVLLGIIFVATIMSWCRCRICCSSRNVKYYKLILEEEGNVLKETMRKSAKEALTKEIEAKIQGDGDWEDCFDVASDLIKESTKHLQQQQQQHLQQQQQQQQQPLQQKTTCSPSTCSSQEQDTNV